MSARVHFYLTSDPVDFSRNLPLSGLCGAVVAKPRPAVMWDVDLRLPKFCFSDCRKCWDILANLELAGLRYVYGLVDGQEQLQAEGA